MTRPILFIISAALLLTSMASRADNIVLAADVWCPYNCDPHGADPGYMVELATLIFNKHGHTIEYRTTNWARALLDARKGKIDGVLGAFRDDAPDFIFPIVEQARTENYFFTLASSPWKFEGTRSLAQVKIAVINGYSYGKEIDDYIATHHSSERIHVASGDHALINIIHMMLAHRADVVVEDRNVFTMATMKLGVGGQFIEAGTLSEVNSPLYIAFSPTNNKSAEYAKILSDGMIELRKTKVLQKIIKKYHMKDWEQK